MLGQIKKAERVWQVFEMNIPGKGKDYLKGARLSDPRPLVCICVEFDFYIGLLNVFI